MPAMRCAQMQLVGGSAQKATIEHPRTNALPTNVPHIFRHHSIQLVHANSLKRRCAAWTFIYLWHCICWELGIRAVSVFFYAPEHPLYKPCFEGNSRTTSCRVSALIEKWCATMIINHNFWQLTERLCSIGKYARCAVWHTAYTLQNIYMLGVARHLCSHTDALYSYDAIYCHPIMFAFQKCMVWKSVNVYLYLCDEKGAAIDHFASAYIQQIPKPRNATSSDFGANAKDDLNFRRLFKYKYKKKMRYLYYSFITHRSADMSRVFPNKY